MQERSLINLVKGCEEKEANIWQQWTGQNKSKAFTFKCIGCYLHTLQNFVPASKEMDLLRKKFLMITTEHKLAEINCLAVFAKVFSIRQLINYLLLDKLQLSLLLLLLQLLLLLHRNKKQRSEKNLKEKGHERGNFVCCGS